MKVEAANSGQERVGRKRFLGAEFVGKLFHWIERNPSWLKRVHTIEEAATAIMKRGVKAVGFERSENDVVPDIREILHMELGTVLGRLKEYMTYRDTGGSEFTTLSDFYLADEVNRGTLDVSHLSNVRKGIKGGGGAVGFRAEKELAEPFFRYIEGRVREVLAAIPDYELNQSPNGKGPEHTPDWHIDNGKLRRSPKRDFINVLIGIYGEHAEFAENESGRNRQTFGEGATTAHWGGADGAWHRSPPGKKPRLSVAVVISRKGREKII